jgi:hypothetical protein
VIVHIGLGSATGGLDIRRMTLQEITFIGTYTYTAQDFRDTAQAMFDGRLGALDWTETRPLSDGASAFGDIRAGRRRAQDHSQTRAIEETSMSEIPHLLVHEQADNVGVVVVEGLTAGTDMLCCITHDNSTFRLTAKRGCADRPQDRAEGPESRRHRIKYGEDIGKIIADIPRASMSTPTIAKPSAGKDRNPWHRNIPTSPSRATGAKTAAWACATTSSSCRWTTSPTPPARRWPTTSRARWRSRMPMAACSSARTSSCISAP